MPEQKQTTSSFWSSKTSAVYTAITVLGISIIFSLYIVWQAQAAVTETSIVDVTAVTGTNKVRPGEIITVLKFSLSANGNENISSTTFKIVQGSNTADSDFNTDPSLSDGLGAFIFRDNNTNNTYDEGVDTIASVNTFISNNPVTVGATTTMNFSQFLGPGLGYNITPITASPYLVAVIMSTSSVEGHSFKVEMSPGTTTHTVTSTSIVSTGILSGTITIDNTAPAVSSVLPTSGVTLVPPDTLVQAVYSEAMSNVNTTTLASIFTVGNTGTFSLKALSGNTQDGTPSGSNLCSAITFSNSSTTLECTHTMLATSTWYSFVVATTTYDIAGNRLNNFASSTFRTGSFSASSNTTPPFIVSTLPMGGVQDFPTNGNLLVEFPKNDSGNMAVIGSGSVTSTSNILLQTVTNGAPSGASICVSGCTLSWDSTNRKLKIDPTTNLTASTNYALTVKNTTANQSGVFIGSNDFVIFFKTGSGTNTTAPSLSAITPSQDSINVARNTGDIMAKFSKDVDPATISYATTSIILFADANSNSTLNNGEALVSSLVSLKYDSMQKALHLGMKQILGSNTRYCVQMGVDITDTIGTAATTTFDKCFTTVNASFTATSPILNFADADNFKVWVAYDQPIDPTTAETKTNYTIESPVGTQLNLTGASINYRPEANGVEITGLGMVTGQQFKVTVTGVKDLSAGATIVANGSTNVAQGVVQSSANTGGFLGGADKPDFNQTDFATFWQNPQRCAPNSFVAGKVTRLTCEFPAPASLTTGAKIILTLPTGFVLTSTTLPAAANSFMNADLNGQGPGVTTISAMATNTIANTVTLTLAHTGTAMTSNDQLRFELDNVYNPSTAGSYAISAIIKDSSGVKQGQTINAAPFSIGAGGSLTISGKVCKGTSIGNTCGGDDTGLQGVKVFIDGMGAGHQEASTNSAGSYSFTALSAGQYNVGIFIDPSVASDIGSGNNFQNIILSNTSATGVDFKKSDLSTTGKNLTFSITGGPASTDMTIFCFAPNNNASSAPVMKKVTTNGSGVASGSLKVQPNTTYQCSVGPYIPFDTMSSGGPPSVPDFSFVPPPPQTVVVANADQTITFALTVTSQQIIGKVVDGNGTAIANVYVDARPVGCFDTSTGALKDCRGGFAQSKTDGTFTLKVTAGTYQMSACAPGMPCSPPTEVTVKDDTGNVGTDNNSTADIYVGGTIVTSATGITVRMLKSDVTIAGQVLDENGSAIKYAFVQAQKVGSSDTCTSFTPQGGGTGSPTDSSGNYTLYVSNGTWRVEAYAGTYGQVNCTIVTISGGTSQSSQNLQATASSYGTISGTVTKNSSNVQGAQINCFGASGRNQTVSGADGTYSMKVKSGTYSCEGFIPGAGPLTPATGITVSSAGTATADLSMGNPGTITIVLGSTMTDAFCDARNSTGDGNGTSENSGGTYTINVPAGTYTVRCGNPRTGQIGSESVIVTAGGTNTVTFTPPTLVTVSGRVTDGTNNLEGAGVTFADKSNGRLIFKQSDATSSGANVSIQLPAGTYSVVAAKSGYIDSGEAQTLTLTTATTFTTRSLTKSNATISFTVQSDSANYTGNAKVIATRTSDNKVATADIDKTTSSGANASLALTDGTWSVIALGDNGKKSATVTVTVSGGSRTDGGTSTLSLATAITGFTATQTQQQQVTPSSGGLFKDPTISSDFELNIPSGALSTSDSTAGTIETATDPTLAINTPGKTFLGKAAISITPKNSSGKKLTELASSVTIKIPYTESDIPTGVSEDQLVCGVWNEATGEWETLATTVDTENNTLTCQTTHFSSFGAIAATGGGTVATSNNTVATNPGSGGGSPAVGPKTDVNSVKINSGNSETTNKNVTLTFSVNKASEMAISNTSDFKNSSFIPYKPSIDWTLPEGDGTKTVYIKFRTSDGGITTEKISIVLNSKKMKQTPTATTIIAPLGDNLQFTKQLNMNSKGAEVMRLQKVLRGLGYFTYPTDTGVYGSQTKIAVKKFQKSKGIAQTGTIGPATIRALNTLSVSNKMEASKPILEIEKSASVGVRFTKQLGVGSRGNSVIELQKVLRGLGYFTYPTDTGTYGSATRAAVMKFQKAKGISQVGRIGPATLKALNEL